MKQKNGKSKKKPELKRRDCINLYDNLWLTKKGYCCKIKKQATGREGATDRIWTNRACPPCRHYQNSTLEMFM